MPPPKTEINTNLEIANSNYDQTGHTDKQSLKHKKIEEHTGYKEHKSKKKSARFWTEKQGTQISIDIEAKITTNIEEEEEIHQLDTTSTNSDERERR